MLNPTRPLAALLIMAGASCASTGSSPAAAAGVVGDAAAVPRPARRGSMNLISEDEIKAAPSDIATAYELVSRLRPTMTRNRQPPSAAGGRAGVAYAEVIVYSDELKLGSIEMLRSIKREEIKEIRYINAIDATNRWGEGLQGGVVQVITKRRTRS